MYTCKSLVALNRWRKASWWNLHIDEEDSQRLENMRSLWNFGLNSLLRKDPCPTHGRYMWATQTYNLNKNAYLILICLTKFFSTLLSGQIPTLQTLKFKIYAFQVGQRCMNKLNYFTGKWIENAVAWKCLHSTLFF